jgi:hypothetical protein
MMVVYVTNATARSGFSWTVIAAKIEKARIQSVIDTTWNFFRFSLSVDLSSAARSNAHSRASGSRSPKST